MNHPSNPFGWPVWRRAILLGLVWALIFFAVTVGMYFVMGVLGWDGTARALVAMGVGPLIAMAIIILWLVMRRPSLAALVPDTPTDDDATMASRQTTPLRTKNLTTGGKPVDEPGESE